MKRTSIFLTEIFLLFKLILTNLPSQYNHNYYFETNKPALRVCNSQGKKLLSRKHFKITQDQQIETSSPSSGWLNIGPGSNIDYSLRITDDYTQLSTAFYFQSYMTSLPFQGNNILYYSTAFFVKAAYKGEGNFDITLSFFGEELFKKCSKNSLNIKMGEDAILDQAKIEKIDCEVTLGLAGSTVANHINYKLGVVLKLQRAALYNCDEINPRIISGSEEDKNLYHLSVSYNIYWVDQKTVKFLPIRAINQPKLYVTFIDLTPDLLSDFEVSTILKKMVYDDSESKSAANLMVGYDITSRTCPTGCQLCRSIFESNNQVANNNTEDNEEEEEIEAEEETNLVDKIIFCERCETGLMADYLGTCYCHKLYKVKLPFEIMELTALVLTRDEFNTKIELGVMLSEKCEILEELLGFYRDLECLSILSEVFEKVETNPLITIKEENADSVVVNIKINSDVALNFEEVCWNRLYMRIALASKIDDVNLVPGIFLRILLIKRMSKNLEVEAKIPKTYLSPLVDLVRDSPFESMNGKVAQANFTISMLSIYNDLEDEIYPSSNPKFYDTANQQWRALYKVHARYDKALLLKVDETYQAEPAYKMSIVSFSTFKEMNCEDCDFTCANNFSQDKGLTCLICTDPECKTSVKTGIVRTNTIYVRMTPFSSLNIKDLNKYDKYEIEVFEKIFGNTNIRVDEEDVKLKIIEKGEISIFQLTIENEKNDPVFSYEIWIKLFKGGISTDFMFRFRVTSEIQKSNRFGVFKKDEEIVIERIAVTIVFAVSFILLFYFICKGDRAIKKDIGIFDRKKKKKED